MTKQEMNDIIKRSLQNQVDNATSLPEDISATYFTWLRGKIVQAQQKLIQRAMPAQPKQDNVA